LLLKGVERIAEMIAQVQSGRALIVVSAINGATPAMANEK